MKLWHVDEVFENSLDKLLDDDVVRVCLLYIWEKVFKLIKEFFALISNL